LISTILAVEIAMPRFDTDFAMLIGGALVRGSEHIAVLNPANEQLLANAPDATPAELDAAIAAARQAFPAWAAANIDSRRAVLTAMAQAIIAHKDDLKRLLTSEQGKPHADAEGEVLAAAHWLMGTATLDLPVVVNEDSSVRYSETRRIPIGVVAAISPWNYPLLLAIFKLGPALLAGNVVVLKPSPYTPLTTLKIGELVKDIVPPGVLNIISGSDRLGPWMTAHAGIDKISFTGSTATGKRVMESAAQSLKRITLELGGNDPAIILPDADPEAIAEQIFWAAFGNNGQICIASKRIYIHADIYDRLRNAIVAYAKTVKIGDGAEQGTRLGPINNRPQYDRVIDLIRDAQDQGYAFLTGGLPDDAPGYFVPITIIDNPPEGSRIVQEEQFGPIMPLLKYDNVDDVIARANACDYGLGASVWGQDEARAMDVARRIQSGTVWVNETRHLSPLAVFGGMKQSGLGVEGGEPGLLEFTQAQTLVRKKRAVI
jgi:acyl-CoA reductase-like NAD-dependent aldehyde dehydrogenase